MSSSVPRSPRSLPASTAITVGVLLAIPILALVLVPIYARKGPELGGWPFFYWYQVAWTILGSAFTYAAYVVVKHARRRDGSS